MRLKTLHKIDQPEKRALPEGAPSFLAAELPRDEIKTISAEEHLECMRIYLGVIGLSPEDMTEAQVRAEYARSTQGLSAEAGRISVSGIE